MRLASIAICSIVVASFAFFAVNRTNAASDHQRETLNAELASSPQAGPPAIPAEHASGVQGALDEATGALTSPFDGLVSGESQWGERIARLALALVLYGFVLGYLARMVRVRLR